MKPSMLRWCALALALCLTGATSRAATVGFVDVPRALSMHPLHEVLDSYAREIAALRSTQTALGASDPRVQAQAGSAALSRDAAAARSNVQRIAENGGASDRAQERQALLAVRAVSGSDRGMGAYRDALNRETDANLRGYAAEIDLRGARAFAARRQQLLEKESTFAFDLARKNSGMRFLLRLKLRNLHLDPNGRARLQRELAALARRDADAVAAMRRTDAAILEEERRRLQRASDAAKGEMGSELHSNAAANLALRLRLRQSAAGPHGGTNAQAASRLRSFASSYRLPTDASTIDAGLRNASSALSTRFAALGDADRRSRVETATQIARLESGRRELYRAIVAQIVRDAARLARARGLRHVIVRGGRPQGSVDLTGAVAAVEARF